MKNKLVANICRGGNTLKFYCSLLVAVLSMTTFSQVKTYYVSTSGSDQNDGSANSPFATLPFAQSKADEAIAAGIESVTINVADGTYDITASESSLNLVNPISIVGNVKDPTKVIILNNSTTHRAVYLEHPSSSLKGLTIERSKSAETWDPSGLSGGGLINMANGLIEDCVITGGSLGSENSTIAQQGGNVYITGGVIRRCKILKGRAEFSKKNTYRSNVAAGNICVVGTEGTIPLIENCLISGGYAYGSVNSAANCRFKAGNMYINGSCRIVNCTIINGWGNGVGGVSVIYNSDYSNCKIVNCIMYNNEGNGTYLYKDLASNDDKTYGYFVNCAIGNATKPNTTCIGVDKAAFENFDGGDYRPRKENPVSPLINAGISRDVYLQYATSSTDLSGTSRFCGKLDIGCYEYFTSGFSIIVR